MLKELACGRFSAHRKELFFPFKIGETYNPLSKAFHHGRLRYSVSDVSVWDNRSLMSSTISFQLRRPHNQLARLLKVFGRVCKGL